MTMKACKDCKRLVEEGNTCPICKSNQLTTSWKGMIVVYDSETSKMAEEAGITSPGRYAIRVRG